MRRFDAAYIESMGRGALPRGVQLIWLCFAPVAMLFAARVAWEKTILTWEQGPQMVGFSMMHIHPIFSIFDPIFSIFGALCCFSIMLWLFPSAVYMFRRRRNMSLLDGLMFVSSLLIAVAMILPDTFFATQH
jgi:hypothetical protein